MGKAISAAAALREEQSFFKGSTRRVREACWVIQAGTGAPPLAFILAGYGDAWVANGLARSLGPEYPVYALQPPSGEELPPASAPELAALYIKRLRERQPHGPYCLSGYSAGAVMALEMARQLQVQGESVGMVALLDPLFLRYTRFELRCYELLQRVCRLSSPLLGRLRVMQILFAMFNDRGLDFHLSVLAGYNPPEYGGELTFFQARWSICRSPRLVAQWRRIAPGRLKLVTVPGDHHTFIRPPHVAELTRRLRAGMVRADRAAG